MTINLPTDGFGIYESTNPSLGSGVYQPRLNQIAAGGFKLIMNYNLLFGTLAQATAYINAAAALGMTVIASIKDVSIWRDNTYSTVYTAMYADAGNPGTGTAFMQYVVNGLKGLSGVWGWYVADEIGNADHTTLKTYTDAVATADSTHPRLIVLSATSGTSFYNNLSTLWDCADVLADDYYPLNYTAANQAGQTEATTNVIAAGLQTTAAARSKQAGIVLQAYNKNQYPTTIQCQPWPSCGTFPAYVDMALVLKLAVNNMTPRVILWYSYFDILGSDNPTQHWNDLVAALANLNTPKYGRF